MTLPCRIKSKLWLFPFVLEILCPNVYRRNGFFSIFRRVIEAQLTQRADWNW